MSGNLASVTRLPKPGNKRLSKLGDPCPYNLCLGDGTYFVDRDTHAPIGWDADGLPDVAVDQFEESAQCPCRPERLRLSRINRAARRLPIDMRGIDFDRHPINNMLPADVEPIRRWLKALDRNDAKCPGLWITGTPGNGKTHLAALAVKKAAEKGYLTAYWRWSTLLTKIRATSFGDQAVTTDDEWIDELRKLDILVLDDVGAEKLGEWGEQMLCDLLSHREEHHRPVIITTNRTLAELEQIYDPRVISRLHACCDHPLEMRDGRDWRRIRTGEDQPAPDPTEIPTRRVAPARESPQVRLAREADLAAGHDRTFSQRATITDLRQVDSDPETA